MYDCYTPVVENEIDDWTETRSGVAELITDGRMLSRWREGVATDGDYSGAGLLGHF
jgi:hypothetical protein